jgi:uncharacterized membrane protein YkvI
VKTGTFHGCTKKSTQRKEDSMMRKNFLLLVFVSFVLMICAAGIISAFINADLRTNAPAVRDIGVFPIVSFAFLIFLILLLHLMLQKAKKSVAICGALKFGVLLGFLFFVPQSILLYEKTSVFFHSEIVHFSIYNILEAFLTRIVLRILYGSRESSY